MNTILKAYKYRLYPTKKQEQLLLWTLSRCRELYNAALSERRDAWKYEHKNITYAMQSGDLPEIKNAIREEYKDIYGQVLQDVLRRLDKAFKNFFRRVQSGDTPGFPRFQGRNRYNSFTYPQKGFSLTEKHVTLVKIGIIKCVVHRPLMGKVKTCTVKHESGQWYIVFSCEIEESSRLPYTDEAIGIDLGITHFAALSSGDFIDNPRHYRHAEKKLQKLQQELSRKKCNSKRRKKCVQRLSKAHRKVRNQRKDFLHQWARRLVSTYETIVFEDLAPSNLSKHPKPKKDDITGQYLPNGATAKAGLNKSIRDAGWATFVTMCEYKAAWAGFVQVIKIDPKYTSQICSGCGAVKKKTLDERWHECECGTSLDRDHNAAVNIKQKWLGRSLQVSA